MERRRHPRAVIDNGAYAVMLAGRHQRLGLLIDIGPDGLACRYLADESVPLEIEAVELFAPRLEFRSDPIPCSTRSAFVMPVERSFSLIPMQRHSFSFESPSSVNRAQIDQFIRLHTARKGPGKK